MLVKVLKDVKSGDMTSVAAAGAIIGAMKQLVGAARGNISMRDIVTDRKTLIASAALVDKGGHQYVRDLLRSKDDKGNAKNSQRLE